MGLTEENWDYWRFALGGVLQHEGDQHVHLISSYLTVLHEDVHVLNPSTLYIAQGLGGSLYAFTDGRLEAVWGSGAYLSHACYGHELGVPTFELACLPNSHKLPDHRGDLS